ncbi:hypothetical protein ACVIGB_000583 [Bradyrhizobium sp. USDA 4341]
MSGDAAQCDAPKEAGASFYLSFLDKRMLRLTMAFGLRTMLCHFRYSGSFALSLIIFSSILCCRATLADSACKATCIDFAHKYIGCNDNSDSCNYFVGLFCIKELGPDIQTNPTAIALMNSECKTLESEIARNFSITEKRYNARKALSKILNSLLAWSDRFRNCGQSPDIERMCLANLFKIESELLVLRSSLQDHLLSGDKAISAPAAKIDNSLHNLIRAIDARFYGMQTIK